MYKEITQAPAYNKLLFLLGKKGPGSLECQVRHVFRPFVSFGQFKSLKERGPGSTLSFASRGVPPLHDQVLEQARDLALDAVADIAIIYIPLETTQGLEMAKYNCILEGVFLLARPGPQTGWWMAAMTVLLLTLLFDIPHWSVFAQTSSLNLSKLFQRQERHPRAVSEDVPPLAWPDYRIG